MMDASKGFWLGEDRRGSQAAGRTIRNNTEGFIEVAWQTTSDYRVLLSGGRWPVVCQVLWNRVVSGAILTASIFGIRSNWDNSTSMDFRLTRPAREEKQRA